MKKAVLLVFTALSFLGVMQNYISATELSDGELTTVISQVKVGEGGTVKVSEKITEKVPVTTGSGSFAEVQFKDASVLRVAPESKFTFSSQDRVISLGGGSLLMNIPPGNGGIRIEADGIQGEATGTTLMASRDKRGNFCFLILETSGSAKVTSTSGQIANLIPGQVALVSRSDGSIRILEINLDAVTQFSPLFASFTRPMPGLEKVMAVADRQAGEVQNEIKSLLSYSEAGLTAEDSDKGPLEILLGVQGEEVTGSKNLFYGDLSTAAGGEKSSDTSGQNGTVLGADSDANGGAITDARQPDGGAIIGATDTAAGDANLASTDTAAGGANNSPAPAVIPPLPSIPPNNAPATPTGANS